MPTSKPLFRRSRKSLYIEDWKPPLTKKLFRVTLPLSILIFEFMILLERSLKMPNMADCDKCLAKLPPTIAIEFAGSQDCANAFLKRWEADKTLSAAKQLIVLDFPFLIVYPLALSTACALVSERRSGLWSASAGGISWMILMAIPLDATENIALLRVLSNNFGETVPALAATCAAIKFSLFGVAFLYAILGFLIDRVFPKQSG